MSLVIGGLETVDIAGGILCPVVRFRILDGTSVEISMTGKHHSIVLGSYKRDDYEDLLGTDLALWRTIFSDFGRGVRWQLSAVLEKGEPGIIVDRRA